MKPLDIHEMPLQGTVCIEASAGTGKTFTIALIVLRLVMETGLDLKRLAVLTYTVPAAGELAERIAHFLRVARDYAASGVSGKKEDETICGLVDSAKEIAGVQVLTRLDEALLNLDLARISTIHGFCKRTLDEFAFETKSSFGTTIVGDEAEMVEEILADFWRIEIATLDPRVFALVNRAATTPDSLRGYLKSFLAFPGLPVDGPQIDMKGLSTQYSKEYAEIRDLWNSSRKDILKMLTENPTRFSQKSYDVDAVPGDLDDVDKMFGAGDLEKKKLERFSLEKLEPKITKNAKYTIPPIPVLSRIGGFIDRFGSLPEIVSASIKVKAYRYLIAELKARQRMLHVRSFNAMISNLADALTTDDESTAAAIRQGLSAVLVDEFQDTDSLQYEIFHRLFHGRENLFFAVIGDPKQAIYRFRGGDIDTYVRARNNVPEENRYTIANNYRSEARLVDGINRIYGIDNPGFQGKGPFLTQEIGYVTVRAKKNLLPPQQGRSVVPPIFLWNLADGEKPDERIIGRRIADAIVEFMDPDRPLTLGPAEDRRPLCFGDIAILVNSHRTAALFKKILGQAGIRSVLGKSGSILKSDEADDVELLLEAMLNPSNEKTVRALLASRLHGNDIDALTKWEANDAARIATLDELNGCRTQWMREGVAAALNHLLSRNKGFSLSTDSERELFQERQITNLRHLIELLHTEELRIGRNPERLLASYLRMRADASVGDPEEMEQRLESDYDAVQIVTMHKAKGLQWPVVFAPDLWHDGVYSRKPVAPILSDERGRRAELDPKKFDEIKAKVHEEARQERMRLAYVTLTRAESLVIAVTANCPPKKGAEDRSPSALLLRSPDLGLLKDEKGPLIRSVTLTPVATIRKLRKPEARNEVRALPQWDVTRRLARRWSVGSYSGLTRGAAQENIETEPDLTTPEGIFAFPKGSDAGTALHSVFERIDFSATGEIGDPQSAENTRLIEGILTDAGFNTKRNPEWVGHVMEMVRRVLHAPIPAVGVGFRLADVGGNERLLELEFHLTAAHPDLGRKPVTEQGLREVLGPETGRIAKGRQLSGFLNGKIDLVFRHRGKWWIVDWKSNHLGNSAERYDRAALERAMNEHNYHLQYHFYALALARYLNVASGGNFDYGSDFGGVLYLFIRGVDAHGNGIYYARPEKEVMGRLEKLL